ncbi:unnamed protein product [Caenorhabditis sp. 36 PRJEB53466]|nr:unnamed protein product [Caenorhabditis sp. 36 PRJEB53466]
MQLLFLILSTTAALANACVYKGEQYKDGETWIARSTFVLRCDISKSGWKTTVIGCRTAEGVHVLPGQSIYEGDTKYECLKEKDGTVEIRRTLNIKRKKSCGDHAIGESWVFEKSFMAKCTERGVQITDCISDAGIPVPLNGSLVLSLVKYDCVMDASGKVSLHRDVTPQIIAPRSTTLSPLEILGPMFKELRASDVKELLAPNDSGNKQEVTAAAQMMENAETTCDFEGENRKAGDVWVSDGIFTKKCTDDGATVILNCIVDDKTIINVDTELTIGKKTYKCYRKKEENRVYYEIGVVYYESILVESGEYTDTAKNVQFGLSIAICLCLIVLFLVNRHLTLSSRHRSKLTVRYQLAENVKALRAFVPFVVIDNCISIMFVLSMLLFQVDFNFDLEVCRKLPGYTISFAVFRAILLLTQLVMPLSVVKQHSSIWNRVTAHFAVRKTTVRNSVDTTDPNKVFKVHTILGEEATVFVSKTISSSSFSPFLTSKTPQLAATNLAEFQINNVLGMDVVGSNVDYFAQLKIQWLT